MRLHTYFFHHKNLEKMLGKVDAVKDKQSYSISAAALREHIPRAANRANVIR